MGKEKELIRNLDAYDIQKYQQNRHPLLFIDFIKEIKPCKYAKGFKNYSYNEWFFPAHFPDEPSVPGFIQIESLTQMFLMTFLSIPENKGKKTGFVSLDNVKFKRKIIPGDRMDIVAELISFKRGLAKGKVIGTVNGELACSLELVIAIPDVLNQFKPK